jgi:hypothetical protein
MEIVSTIASAGVKTNSPQRILMVDDDNDTRQPCAKVLVDAGYPPRNSQAIRRIKISYDNW